MTAALCEVCGRRLTASAGRRIGPVCERRTRPARATAASTSLSHTQVDPTAAEAAGQLAITEDQEEQHAHQ